MAAVLASCSQVPDSTEPQTVPSDALWSSANGLGADMPLPFDESIATVARRVCFPLAGVPAQPTPTLLSQDRRQPSEALHVFRQANRLILCKVAMTTDARGEVLFQDVDDSYVSGVDVAATIWAPASRGSILAGRVSDRVSSAMIHLQSGRRIVATIGGGAFAASWVDVSVPSEIRAYDAAGLVLEVDSLEDMTN